MRAALKVALPEGFHVQSNKPRDPSLIATELAVEGPSGIQVDELVFPKAVEFPQEGLDQPLLVFDREFTIGVRLALPANLPPGEVTVPARLRYQACVLQRLDDAPLLLELLGHVGAQSSRSVTSIATPIVPAAPVLADGDPAPALDPQRIVPSGHSVRWRSR